MTSLESGLSATTKLGGGFSDLSGVAVVDSSSTTFNLVVPLLAYQTTNDGLVQELCADLPSDMMDDAMDISSADITEDVALRPTDILPASSSLPASQVTGVISSGEAGDRKPASAVQEGMLAKHLKATDGPKDSLEAFQLASGSTESASSLAGLLNCEKVGFISPQEQISGKLQSSVLNNSYSVKKGLQSLDASHFKTVSNNNVPSSQECLESQVVLASAGGNTIPSSNEFISSGIQSQHSTAGNNACTGTLMIEDSAEKLKSAHNIQSPVSSVQMNQEKGVSYSQILAPPNVHPSTTGSAPECGVSVERLPGYSLESYAWAVTNVVGKGSITFIGRNPSDDDYVLIFVKNQQMAETLVNKGIWMRSKWLNVSYYQLPAVRLTISGILPFLPDCLIIDALSPYGKSVYSILRKIPAAVKSLAFKGVSSFRRELYLIKNKAISLPETIEVSFLGINYKLEVSTTGARCFNCGSLQHTVKRCKNQDSKKAGSEVDEKDSPKEGNDQTQAFPDEDQNLAKDAKCIGKNKDVNIGMSDPGRLLLDPPSKPASREFFSQCNLAKLPLIGIIDHQNSVSKEQMQAGKASVSNEKIGHFLSKSVGFVASEMKKDSKSFKEISMDDDKMACQIEKKQAEDEHDDSEGDSEGSIKLKKKKRSALKKKQKKQQVSSELPLEVQDIYGERAATEVAIDTQTPVSMDVDINVTKMDKKKVEENKSSSDKVSEGELQKHGQESLVSSPYDNVKAGVEVAEEWCRRVSSMRFGSRKRLAAQFVSNYPKLQTLLTAALSVPKLFPSYSVKYKNIQQLMEEARQIESGSRSTKVPKRKQAVLTF